MASSIVGTLPISQTVDHNGSLSLDIALQVPPAKMAPKLSLAYHSASNIASTVGMGWVLRGASMIERVGATQAQDGYRGVVNYDSNDRFALDGQRLVNVGGNEYRFELEQWSKIIADGPSENPSSWTEYKPDGSKRSFGTTQDSNVKAVDQTTTRVWAIAEDSDAFTNYVSYAYLKDTVNGSFYLDQVSYGGNHSLSLMHQRQVKLDYTARPDVYTKYIGGFKVRIDKRLFSISSLVHSKLVHKHVVDYNIAPITGASRVSALTLVEASGASVRPLRFNWVDGSPSVFEEPVPESTIDFVGASVTMMPMDVHATGRSDVVIASHVTISNVPKTRIATHLSDANGKIMKEAVSVHSDLPYHVALFPLDVSGDGRTDIVHISRAGTTFTITVLLSTPTGFQVQSSTRFTPESTGGSFRCGDFQGNGRVGMVYIYQTGGTNIKFVQFLSDGTTFTALPALAGPTGVSLNDLKIVVGDLDGNGEEDVFLLSPKTQDGKKFCYISFLESQNGNLKFQSHDGLLRAGESVTWTNTINIFPFSADEDGKTSLLVASKKVVPGTLTLQLLRSTGRTLLPSPTPIETSILYDGNLTIARAASTNSLNLINTFQVRTGNPHTRINVLTYRDGAFEALGGVRQGPSYASVTWGDFRGVGRSDPMLNTQTPGKFNVRPMPCASLQPVDFISSYTNGMEARVDVVYAPLSDRTMYSSDSGVSTAPLAALNAMARNISSTVNLSTSDISEMSHSRSEIVYFPSWVVKQVTSTPYAVKPDVKEQTDYNYRNARFDYEGRGWLGFQTVTKSAKVLGTTESTWYKQNFPFIGQVDRTEMLSKFGEVLQTRSYGWSDITEANSRKHAVRMSSLNEVYYDRAVPAYSANASYQYDAYGNITSLVITSPESGASAISIDSTYQNSTTGSWVLGNKTREVVKQGNIVLKDAQFQYLPGTHSPTETKNWVKSNEWSTQTVQFDPAGNELVSHGPGPAHQEFVYDNTYSHILSSTTSISLTSPSLTESTTFSLENGKPLSYSDANGKVTSYTYDILGRNSETYQGDPTGGQKLIKKESYVFENNNFKHVTSTRTSWDREEWFVNAEYVDGVAHVWRTEQTKPDGSSGLICVETEIDGAGRVLAQSREFFSGSSPAFTRYTYDARSRVIQEDVPPPSVGLPPTIITSQYGCRSGLVECVETTTSGTIIKTSLKKMQYLPNADKPAVDKLVQPFVVVTQDELGQEVQTSFDGLGRPTCVKDPNDVRLVLGWDGLSRLTERYLSQPRGTERKDLTHIVLAYDDDRCQMTMSNVLTGTHTTTTTDFSQRPISSTSPDETNLAYSYDTGGQYSKGRLMSVTSASTGVSHRYDYDFYGHLVKDALILDGQTHTTLYTWSPLGQLLGIVNPDGTKLNRVLCPDGKSVSRVDLQDAAGTLQARVSLTHYEDVFGRPLVCDFGNGLSSLSAMHANGVVASITLSKSGQNVHRQEWKLDASSHINSYDRESQGNKSGSFSFQYDASGQLTKAENTDPMHALGSVPAKFTYNSSGNICEKDNKVFANDGWQILNVKKADGTIESSFTYSSDGAMLSKLDGSGATVQSMRYDSQGRLIQLGDSHMVYDFGGRLIKCTRANGDVTVYPSQTYEVEISAGKKAHTSYLVHGYRRSSFTHVEGGASTVRYFHNDHLGSTVAVSDAGGNIITQYKYDSFGQVSCEGPDVARYKFSGKELIDGLYYFGARFYDPALGRFLTLDNFPVNLDDISPCTFNMYTFSRNNPINYIDLNGNAPWWHWLVDAILIVVAVALMFIPVVGEVALVAMGATTGALLGAGLAGLNADIGGASDKEWGIQMGIGAVFGGITGGASAAVDIALPAATLSTKAAGMAKWAGRTALRMGVNGAIGKAAGVLQRVVDNAVHGRSAGDGLLEMLPGQGKSDFDWIGAVETGAVTGVGILAGKYTGSKTSGSFRPGGPKGPVAAVRGKLGLGKSTGLNGYKPEYPLRQSGVELVSYRQGTQSRYVNMTETTRL